MDLYTLSIMENMSWLTILAVVGITSEATGFEKENLVDYNPDTKWKGTTDADQNIQYDLGSALAVEGAYIFLNNYSSGSWTNGEIRLLSSTTGLSGSFVERATLSLDDDTTPHRILDIGSTQTFRYWIIQIDAISGETIPEISFAMLSNKTNVVQSHEFPVNDSDEFKNTETKAAGGRKFSRGVNNSIVTILPRSYKFSGTDDMEALEDSFINSKGTRFPLVIIEEDVIKLVKYMNKSFRRSEQDYQYYEPKVTFETLPFIDDGDTF